MSSRCKSIRLLKTTIQSKTILEKQKWTLRTSISGEELFIVDAYNRKLRSPIIPNCLHQGYFVRSWNPNKLCSCLDIKSTRTTQGMDGRQGTMDSRSLNTLLIKREGRNNTLLLLMPSISEKRRIPTKHQNICSIDNLPRPM